MTFLLIPIMSFLARLSGSSYLQKWLGITPNTFWESFFKRVPEILFGLMIAATATIINDYGFVGFCLSAVVSFFAMELGHGTFYAMRGYNHSTVNGKDRIQTLEKLLRPVYTIFSKNIYHPAYSWFMMGAKGSLIALPMGFIPTITNAVLWPVSYYIGHVILKKPNMSEWISGALIGLIMFVCIIFN